MENTLYAELGKLAIDGGAGNHVRDEPDYERLENEIGKMSNPSTSASLDWALITQLCTTLLSSKGKDMLVAAYLGGALMQTRGLDGLADGMQVLADMMQTYWDTLQPPLARVRARRNAMQWLIERVQSNAAETDWSTLVPQEPALVDRLRASVGAIDALTGEKDPDAPPFRVLLPLLSQIALIEVAVAAPPVADVAREVAPAVNAAASLPPAASLGPDANLSQATDDALALLSSISDRLLQVKLDDPAAYRLARVSVWAAIEQSPPNIDGLTRISAPIAQVTEVLVRLRNAEANEDIVRFAEAQLPAYPFWLDLHCACAQALERLGSAYTAARDEVQGETGRLVARMAGLAELRFESGMPFADTDTQAWLATLGAPSSAAGAGNGGAPAASDTQSGIATAKLLAADGQLVEAAAVLQRLLAQPLAPGSKLLVRIRLAELLDAERPKAQLQAFGQAIVAEIDRHQLDSWDAPLALQGLQVAYRIAARDSDDTQQAAALLLRIVALDVKAAVNLVT